MPAQPRRQKRLPRTQTRTLMATRRAAFGFIFFTVLLDMLAVGIIVPILPKLIVSFVGGDIGKAAQISGVFSFTWALMQFFFSPVIGALSDRFGRRPIVLLSNFGLGLDYILMALAPSLSWLWIGRVIAGITAASFSAASAYISDVTLPQERAKHFGILGAAFGFGFVVGPAMGGYLGSIDLRLPFWVAASLSLANGLYGLFVLPESHALENRTAFNWRKANPIGSLNLLKSKHVLTGLATVAVLYNLAHDALPSVFVLYASHRYGWNDRTIGLTLAFVGVCSMIVSGGVVGPVVKKLGERRALLIGHAFGIIGFAIYGLAPHGWMLVSSIPVTALWGLITPSIQALMTKSLGPDQQGQLQGSMASLRGLTGLAGPVIFTQIFALAVSRSVNHGHDAIVGAPYMLSAVLLSIGAWVAFRFTRMVNQPAADNSAT